MPNRIKTIEKFVAQMPVHGFALHGTSLGNIESIKEEGISRGTPFVAPIRKNRFGQPIPHREYLERLIGSIMYASNYAVMKTQRLEPQEEHMPAIIILKGTENNPFIGGWDEDALNTTRKAYPENKKLRMGKERLGEIQYASFGKQIGRIPPEMIASVVHIPLKDFKRMHASGNVDRKMRSTLAVKVLKELKRLAAEHAKDQELK